MGMLVFFMYHEKKIIKGETKMCCHFRQHSREGTSDEMTFEQRCEGR